MSLVQFISKGTAKTKLAILSFSYCREFVENSYEEEQSDFVSVQMIGEPKGQSLLVIRAKAKATLFQRGS